MKNNSFTARHFIMIPFQDENFIASYENLCEKLKSEKPQNFDPELLQKPSKLHISALSLPNNERTPRWYKKFGRRRYYL